jgi:hypothetical protein
VKFIVHRIGLTNAASSSASKINSSGQIVGTVDGLDGVSRGYIFSTITGNEIERGAGRLRVHRMVGTQSIRRSGRLLRRPGRPELRDIPGLLETGRRRTRLAGLVGRHQRQFHCGHQRLRTDRRWRKQPGLGAADQRHVRALRHTGLSGQHRVGHQRSGYRRWRGLARLLRHPNGLVYNLSIEASFIWNYPGAAQTTLYGINNRGDIVGEFKPNLLSANVPFVRWADGSTQVLDFPGLSGVRIYDISDDRVVVGRYKDAANKNRSFYATPAGRLEPRPTPWATATSARCMPMVRWA